MNLTEFNQPDRCVHFFCAERSVPPVVNILLYMFSVAVVLITLCGNLFVIISVFQFKQLHTPSNMLVFSLAVSDFLISALVMPPLLLRSIESCWILGRYFCMCFLLINRFLGILCVYNVTLIAVDRYLALTNPFLYKKTVSVKKMCIVLYCNWCMSLVYIITFYYYSGTFTSSVLCPGECSLVMNKVWPRIDLVIAFIFPCYVIIILYTRVFMIAKKHATAIRELNNHTWSKTQRITSHSMKSERKAAKVLGILVSVFLICLFPYFIYNLLGDVIELQVELLNKLLLLAFLNATLNPLIYALFYPWFRMCVKIIITLQIFQKGSSLINVLS